MKWIEGMPSAKRVLAVTAAAPVTYKFLNSRSTEISVLSTDGTGDDRSFEIERVAVEDPDLCSHWICVIPGSLDVPNRTRFVHLRVHPGNGKVLSAIGFCREWIYLERSKWGPISKFMPVTASGLPLDYVAD